MERDKDTPREEDVEVVRMGGDVTPPRRKTQTYLTSHLKVRTCYCGDSMETTHITTMGHT